MRTRLSANPKLVKYLKAALMAAGMVALMAAVAFAQEQGGGGEDAVSLKDWVWRIVDFAIIVGGLFYVWRRFLKDLPGQRIAAIKKSLEDAKRAREEALSRLASVEARLKDKDAELKGILEMARANGEKEKEILVKEAEEISADIIAGAKEIIDAELVKAKDAIRREAALKAVELAEKLVKENVSKEDQARMLQEYLANVGR